MLGVAQAPPHLGEHFPVRTAFAEATSVRRAIGDAAFGVGHGTRLLAPLRRRQQQMGVVGCFRVGIGLAHHHQRAVAHGRFHPVQIRHAHQWVGGRHPPKIKLTPFHRFHLLPGPQSRLGVDPSGRQSPGLFHLVTVFGIGHQSVARQQMRQASGLPSAHGIGLAGEGKRARSLLADLAGEQMQVDQPLHHGRSFTALVHAH